MHRRHCEIAFGVLLATTLLGGGQCRAQGEDPTKEAKKTLIGKIAPAIKGEFAVKGRVLSLADLRGKVVLVDFWAVWCGPCKAAFPVMNALHREFRDENFTVVGVTTYYQRYGFDANTGKLSPVGEVTDEDGKVTTKGGLDQDQEHAMLKDFAAHHKLIYPLMTLTNENWKRTGEAYGRRGIPTAVLIDRLGIVRHVEVGINPSLEEQLAERIRKLVNER